MRMPDDMDLCQPKPPPPPRSPPPSSPPPMPSRPPLPSASPPQPPRYPCPTPNLHPPNGRPPAVRPPSPKGRATPLPPPPPPLRHTRLPPPLPAHRSSSPPPSHPLSTCPGDGYALELCVESGEECSDCCLWKPQPQQGVASCDRQHLVVSFRWDCELAPRDNATACPPSFERHADAHSVTCVMRAPSNINSLYCSGTEAQRATDVASPLILGFCSSHPPPVWPPAAPR